jgi:ribosomal protein S18 acetylase RimI-like enzyme
MDTQLRIRPMNEADIPACARIVAETGLWRVHYGVTYTKAEALFRAAFQAGNHILVADDDTQIAGFVWFFLHGTFQRSGYIRLIGVRGDRRSQGIGAALLREAETHIFAHSDHVFLLVSHFNHAAQTFYQRLGYQQVGSIPDYVIPGITELIFYKRCRDTHTKLKNEDQISLPPLGGIKGG